MSILRKMWVQGSFPHQSPVLYKDEYVTAMHKVLELESMLTAEMSDEQKKVFLKYEESVSDMGAINDESTFVTGFRMGAQVMLDVLRENG